LDYDQKLIFALDCPIRQTRMFVIDVLRRRKTQGAVSKLCRMFFEDREKTGTPLSLLKLQKPF